LAKKKEELRKREAVKVKIASMKKDISQELLKANKKGNFEECDPERKNKQIINYCSVNFRDDGYKQAECIKKDNFCYMCCENEYGDLHLELRDHCYSKCNDYYYYKKKFVHTKVLNTYVDINPHMTRGASYEEVMKADKAIKKFNKPYLMKSVNAKDVLSSKFLEKNVKIEDSKIQFSKIDVAKNENINGNLNDNSNDNVNDNDNREKKVSEDVDNNNIKSRKNRNISIAEMIEEEKKKELLLKIKEDLSFD